MRMEEKRQRAGTTRRGGIVEQRGRHGAEQKRKQCCEQENKRDIDKAKLNSFIYIKKKKSSKTRRVRRLRQIRFQRRAARQARRQRH